MNWEIATWLIIFAACLIIEIITLGLTTIWACGGALIAMIIAFFSGSLALQVVAFLIVTTILFFTTRPLAKNDIDNLKSQGQVMIGGVEWTARSKNGDTIESGTEVVINEISGVKAIVTRV